MYFICRLTWDQNLTNKRAVKVSITSKACQIGFDSMSENTKFGTNLPLTPVQNVLNLVDNSLVIKLMYMLPSCEKFWKRKGAKLQDKNQTNSRDYEECLLKCLTQTFTI